MEHQYKCDMSYVEELDWVETGLTKIACALGGLRPNTFKAIADTKQQGAKQKDYGGFLLQNLGLQKEVEWPNRVRIDDRRFGLKFDNRVTFSDAIDVPTFTFEMERNGIRFKRMKGTGASGMQEM